MILCDILFVFPGYVTIRRQQFHQSIPGRFRICLALVVTLQNESPKQQEHYIHSGKESWSTPSDTSSWGSQSRGGKQQSWTKTPSAEQHAEETQKPLRARLLRVKAAQSCPTLRPHELSSPWNSPGQDTGVPFPSPRDLPNPGMEPRSSALQEDSSPAEPPTPG